MISKMIKAIIIDDEKSGRETLGLILAGTFSQRVAVAATAASVQEGVGLIQNIRPDLVFLDMEMPNEHGLDILKYFPSPNFIIIVTTAHREYGIESIKAGVADYLLKPVDVDELDIAIVKIEKELARRADESMLRQIIQKVGGIQTKQEKIPLLINNSQTIFVEPSTIVRCEADGNYTKFYLSNGKSLLITKLIKGVEGLLAGYNFLRVHKSHLINMNEVKSFQKSSDEITMNDDSVVPLSRNVKDDFLGKMKI